MTNEHDQSGIRNQMELAALCAGKEGKTMTIIESEENPARALRSGVLANRYGVFPCPPDREAKWRGGIRDEVTLSLLWLEGGMAALRVNYWLKDGGENGPIRAQLAVPQEELRREAEKALADVVGMAEARKVVGVKTLKAWTERVLSNEEFFTCPTEAFVPRNDEVQASTSLLPVAADAAREAALAERQAELWDAFRFGGDIHAAMALMVMEKMCAAARVKLFRNAKESKAYKNLPLKTPDGNLRTAQNLDEFCRLFLGVSYRAMAEESQTLEALGESIYESVKQLDLPRASVRLLVSLPEDEREELQSAVAAADKDRLEVASIIHDLVDKLAAERKKNAEAQDRLASKDKVIAAKEKTISALQEREATGQSDDDGGDGESAPDAFQAAVALLDDATLKAVGHAGPGLISALAIFREALPAEGAEDTFRTYAATALRRVFAALNDVASRHDIGLMSDTGEGLLEPADIDVAEMESMRAAIAAYDNGDGDDADTIDAE
jgi:hypothetical protein